MMVICGTWREIKWKLYHQRYDHGNVLDVLSSWKVWTAVFKTWQNEPFLWLPTCFSHMYNSFSFAQKHPTNLAIKENDWQFSEYLTGLRAIISSFFLSFLFRSCSVFFSLSGTRRSLDCMSLMTSCRSDSEGKVRWHTGQQGSRSSVSWLMNCVYTAVAPASMAVHRQREEKKKGQGYSRLWDVK